ncbi:MotA/TolQ/ExbB proton channel family protein [Aurantibacillus circumpalustris]|uniref:MotA/TolQ/ExbB proton channel family protein n=1 Tax=Aurantibacillus circumpalustris TaxID=3036359 RepID=UPI00295A6D14|nr:MotA/TolQ/ExbB proton channel family protein [Aurantibacillus circumpalustris]
MLNFILQIGGAAATSAQAGDSSMVNGIQTAGLEITETKISLIEMIFNGGYVMIPLAILLVVAIYILIERLLVLGKASKRHANLVTDLKEMIHSGNISGAIAMCKNLNSPESSMIEQGVKRVGQPVLEIRTAMDKSGTNEISKLEKNMNVLNIIGRIAPMFGFVGTIIGVITIFYDISLAKTVEIEIISKGLYQKMVTSASGLIIGVLAFIFYHWLNGRIDKIANKMEDTQIKFLDMLNEPTK